MFGQGTHLSFMIGWRNKHRSKGRVPCLDMCTPRRPPTWGGSRAGTPPRDGTAACETSAIFVESATWTQYLLAITVSAVSYTLLLHPLSRVTLLLERCWILIVVLVCSVSVGIAALQASLYTAVYVGGFCWNVSFF